MNLGWWVTCFCLILLSHSFVCACTVWLYIGFTCKTVVLIIRYRCFYHWKQVCFHFIIVYYDRLFNKDTPKQLAFHKMSMACTQLSFSLINCIQNLRMIQICLVIPWWAILFVIYWICLLFLRSVNFIIFFWFNQWWDWRWIMFDLWLNLKHFVEVSESIWPPDSIFIIISRWHFKLGS